MGWASGSGLAQEMYRAIRRDIPVPRRKRVAESVLRFFEEFDADDWDESSILWSDSERPLTWDDENDEDDL
jgi:hypothetical protein